MKCRHDYPKNLKKPAKKTTKKNTSYHGWSFDGEGVLRDVPAAEHADEWPLRQLVESYPIVEKGGFVWMFYGELIFFSTFPFSLRSRCALFFFSFSLTSHHLPLALPLSPEKNHHHYQGSPDLPEDERPPIPFVPELEDPEWKAVYGSIEMEAEHHDVFQNAIDVAHIHYLVSVFRGGF